MNYRILFFIIVLAVFLMGSVLFFVVSKGAKQAQESVLADQEGRVLASPLVTKSIFSLGEPQFATVPHSCNVPFLDEGLINVVLRYREVPRACEIFVNNKYISGHRDLEPECIGECPYGEFERTFPLGKHDVRESHVVRICCDDICIEKMLSPLCADNRIS